MKQNEIENQLKAVFANEKIAQNISFPDSLSCEMMQVCSEREVIRPIGLWQFVKQQIRFVGWKIWILQLVMLIFLSVQFLSITKLSFGISLNMISHFVFACALLTSAVILPVIYRSRRYQMHEVEACTYFSSSRILLSNVLIIWLGDLAVISCIALLVASKTATGFSMVVLDTFLPFGAASFGIFCVMGHCPAKFLLPISSGIYAVLLLSHILINVNDLLFFNQTIVRLVLCICFAVACLQQLYTILQKPVYAEMQVI